MQTSRNRRVSRRQKPKRSTKAVCLKGAFGLGRNIALSVLDVSETGARLVVKESLAPGPEVEVSLESIQLPRPAKRAATVGWCVAAENGTYGIGVRFAKMLGFADWQSLTASS